MAGSFSGLCRRTSSRKNKESREAAVLDIGVEVKIGLNEASAVDGDEPREEKDNAPGYLSWRHRVKDPTL